MCLEACEIAPVAVGGRRRTCGDSADHEHRRLVASVPSGADEHRHEEDNDGVLTQELLVRGEDKRRARLEDEQADEQPHSRAQSSKVAEIVRKAAAACWETLVHLALVLARAWAHRALGRSSVGGRLRFRRRDDIDLKVPEFCRVVSIVS